MKNGMLRWREGNSWIVASSKFDIVSQGSTLEEAWQRWASAFATTMLHHNVEAPPLDVLKRWLVNNELCNMECNLSIN
jgi:hypothetical protein